MEVTPQEQLENRIELEKDTIPVPEKTIEAARDHAYEIVSKLRTLKGNLTDSQTEELGKVARKLRANIVATGVVDEDSAEFELNISSNDPQECANEFEDFCAECDEAVDILTDKKLQAGQRLTWLAKRILKGTSEVDSKKISARIHAILADATKLDLMRNLSNIENKSRKDQPLRVLVDWNEVSRLSPGVNKFTKVQDLKVQDLKNLLVSLRGGKEVEE